jgi:hypothetical protein
MANPLPMPFALVMQKALHKYCRVTSLLPLAVSWNDMVVRVYSSTAGCKRMALLLPISLTGIGSSPCTWVATPDMEIYNHGFSYGEARDYGATRAYHVTG